jgi:hypothetical protein
MTLDEHREVRDAFTGQFSPVFTLSRHRKLLDLTLCGGQGLSGCGMEHKLYSSREWTKGWGAGGTYLSLDKFVQVFDRLRLNHKKYYRERGRSEGSSRTLSNTVFIS